MVQKKKAKKAPKAASAASETTVTRIVATDTDAAPKKPTTDPTKTKTVAKTKAAEVVAAAPSAKKKKRTVKPKGILRAILAPFIALGRYFKGAWVELKQVRWPTRQATWGLTFAVIVYSAFFVILVLLLDALFKYLFELMLGK